jgi:hypothetical protein
MVIAIPSLLNVVKGWHARPGKETVTIGLRQQADRSPSGTGRAHVSPTTAADKHLNVLDASTSQTATEGALTVATVTTQLVDHDRGHTYILTGISALPGSSVTVSGFQSTLRVPKSPCGRSLGAVCS